MAKITNKFIFFDTLNKFNTRLNANEIPSTSIVFVYEEDSTSQANPKPVLNSFIYAQGKKFQCDFDPTTISADTLKTILGDYYLKSENLQGSVASSNTTNPVSGKAVADAITAAIQALDVTEVDGSSTGQAVIKISETDGKITATLGDVAASHVTYSPTSNDTVQTTVQGAIHEIYGKISDGDITITRTTGGTGTWDKVIHADGNTYTISKGNETIAQINIARDMVVSSGSVITATGSETDVPTGTSLTVGKKYVRLVVANSDDGKNIYIPVDELYDDYTFTDRDEIDFTETNNVVTATIKTGSIAKGKLTADLQSEITTGARSTVSHDTNSHVRVTATTGSGATPNTYVVGDDGDIASKAFVGTTIPAGHTATTVIGYVEEVEGKVDNLEDYVGTIPSSGTGSDATSVIDYVDAKVNAIGGENLWEHGTSNSSTKTKSGNTSATANYSFSAGDHTSATNVGEAALGTFNNSVTGANASAQTMFSVGIGASSAAPSNGLEVRKDGSIYLHITKDNADSYTRLQDELEWYIG